jgi:tetrahydromethanopterin S-methyltransferase subunit D
MAMRECPQCGKKVPATRIVAYTDKLECPHCEATLTVSLPSRVIGAFIGLGAGYLVYSWARNSVSGEAAWVLPAVYSFLAYSFFYTIYLMTTADLIRRQVEPDLATTMTPLAAAHAHGAGHQIESH